MADHRIKRPRLNVEEDKRDREVLYNGTHTHAGVANQAVNHHDNLGPNDLNQYAYQHALPHNTLHQALQPTNHSTREYDCTVVDGQGVAQQGDNYGVININHGTPEQVKEDNAYKDKLDKLMKSLTFERMDARLHNVAAAFPKTCKWLFRHQSFLSWNNESKVHEHNGFLWIKGKPGCGKSTIMKSTWAWAKRKWSGQWTILNYFFNARAPNSSEKSSLGLYRSLVHQLLAALPQFTDCFMEKFSSKVRADDVNDWTELELQGFLIDVVQGTTRPRLCLFVDALDEGDEEDIRAMINFLETLAIYADEHGSPLRICLSSRHYPHISISKGLTLVVEDQRAHDEDIELFVKNRLLEPNSKRTDELRTEVCRKSAGVFLWVVLVVPMLNQIHDKGKGPDAMQQRLDQIPPGLEGLFVEILAKNAEEMHNCITLLQWVLFSTRLLTSQELYLGVQQYSNPNLSTPDESSLGKYLLDCSRGLVEVTKASPPVVQFIHETVREFLLGSNGLGQVDSTLVGNVLGRSHDKLRQICFGYLRCACEKLKTSELDPLPEVPSDLDPSIQAEIETSLPFLAYATASIFPHAEAAQAANITQRMFIKDLICDADYLFTRWKQLRDGHQKFKARRYKHEETLLYVLVDLRCHHLVTEVISSWSWMVRHTCGRYGNALQAASFQGHETIVQCLIDNGADVNAIGGEYKHAVIAALYGKHVSLAELLQKHDASLTQKQLDETLVTMVARGWVPGVRFLLEHRANVHAKNKRDQPLLLTAIVRKHSVMAELLLERGSSLIWPSAEWSRSTNYEFSNALQLACFHGLADIVRVLCKKGQDPNLNGRSALRTASSLGHLSIVKCLLENGAYVNACDEDNRTALHEACCHNRLSIVKCLLENHANVNAYDKKNRTALHEACRNGHLSIVKCLLENDANVNIRDGSGAAPLQIACRWASTDIVKLLLDHGAEKNAAAGSLVSALHVVVGRVGHGTDELNRQLELLKMLLEAGANIREGPGQEKTLCSLAADRYCDVEVLKLLIERGADVNVKDTEDLCALVVASRDGTPRQVAILIRERAGYDSHHGVDHDVWNQAIEAVPTNPYRTDEGINKILQLLRYGRRQAEERWAKQQRESSNSISVEVGDHSDTL